MSHSGRETKTVAENVWEPDWEEEAFTRTEERNDALQKLDKLEAEAAGMRVALNLDVQIEEFDCPHNNEQSCRCRELEEELWKKYHNARDKALSGEAGKEISREMGHLKDTIDLRDVALRSAEGSLKASTIETELIEHERDEARVDLDREQKKNLQERKDLTALYAANMEVLKEQLAEVTKERDEAKADRTAAMKSAALVSRHRDDLRAKLAEMERELDETRERQQEARLELQRRIELRDKALAQKSSQLETAQKELLKNTTVPLAQYEAARRQWAELKNALDRADYVPRSEVSRAVEAERAEISRLVEHLGSYQPNRTTVENVVEAIRAKGKG